MSRLAIVVEGETEEDFVRQVLADILAVRGVYATALRPDSRGGNISVERLARAIVKLLPPAFDYVTTLVDFYGFRHRPAGKVDEVEQAIVGEVQTRISYSWDETRFIPYIQMHEFEALLFSDVTTFRDVAAVEESDLHRLGAIRSQFPTPEDINDNYNTAPSRRIREVIPSYSKRALGPPIAQLIGLGAIRAECPRFNQWLTRLESLS